MSGVTPSRLRPLVAAPRRVEIFIENRAGHDLRRLQPREVRRIRKAIEALGEGAPNLDIKALVGRSPWRRMRVGDFRILFRPVEGGLLIHRIVDRRDLQRAADGLR